MAPGPGSRNALDEAWSLVSGWSLDERRSMAAAVAEEGLRAAIPEGGAGDVLSLARSTVRIAKSGLARQGCLDKQGRDESGWLKPLHAFLEPGLSPADLLLQRWNGELGQEPSKLVEALVY